MPSGIVVQFSMKGKFLPLDTLTEFYILNL